MRPPQPHPDAERPTRRMPFEQLRTLVVELVGPESDTDPVTEFDARPTNYVEQPRVSTLDQLIAALPRYDHPHPHEPRFGRGSSPHLSRGPEPSIRAGAYTVRPAPAPIPAADSPEPPRPRRSTGRGSPRR